jgi:hypothetical protein
MDIVAISVLIDAKEGRYERLIERLRDTDGHLDPSEREFIADLLLNAKKLLLHPLDTQLGQGYGPLFGGDIIPFKTTHVFVQSL